MKVTLKETIITPNKMSSETEAEINTFKKDITQEKVSRTVAKTLMVSTTTSIFTGMTSLKGRLKIISSREMKSTLLRILINIYNLSLLIKKQDCIFTETLSTILPFKLNFHIQITINNNRQGSISHLLLTITVHNQSTTPIFQVMNMMVTLTLFRIWILPIMIQNKPIYRLKHPKSIIIKELTANIQ